MTAPERTPPQPGPVRTCVGCRRALPQSMLVRCTLGPNGATVDRTAPGRGAWVCSTECVRTAVERKGFERTWRRQVPRADLEGLVDAVTTAFGQQTVD